MVRINDKRTLVEIQDQEFEALRMRRINLSYEAERRFLEWMQNKEIVDNMGLIKNGNDFYTHLINKARDEYRALRQQGYEPEMAFLKSTSNIEKWFERSLENKPGTIFVNFSSEFYHRMRHLEED